MIVVNSTFVVWIVTMMLHLTITSAFLPRFPRAKFQRSPISLHETPDSDRTAVACLVGVSSMDGDLEKMCHALRSRGFGSVSIPSDGEDTSHTFVYRYQKATGMLQHVSSPENQDASVDVPRWIPLVSDMETVLITNGWSFLDPDENEPMSAFNVDAANLEGAYKPKWEQDEDSGYANLQPSLLGFDLQAMSSVEISQAAAAVILNEMTLATLLNGATDPPEEKRTHNEFDFSGAAGQSDIPRGVFACAIGGLPLFSSLDLSPETASSGWLSFSRPISDDHVILVQPKTGDADQRVEAVCARSRCHLGHFFGERNGYCINARGLDFIKDGDGGIGNAILSHPISWRPMDNLSSNVQEQIRIVTSQSIHTESIVFGAGCFWHVEAALRRLPGVVDTVAGYAGGTIPHPTYEAVCHQSTDHAEVVLVEFDPTVLPRRVLVDSFLALHDPTKMRALGKHSSGTGQYRSCIFALDPTMAAVASEALRDCEIQLQRQLNTANIVLGEDLSSWFWKAEDIHQRHEEHSSTTAVEMHTLSTVEWLERYGRRAQSILGSSETINYSVGA